MLKLWGRVNSINVQKVLWTLEIRTETDPRVGEKKEDAPSNAPEQPGHRPTTCRRRARPGRTSRRHC